MNPIAVARVSGGSATPAPPAHCRCGAQRGFTMMELLTTITVVAIMVSLAVPSFRTFVLNSRLTTESNTLVYSLSLARSTAVKLDQQVEVCASSDGASCTGGNWASGWIVCYPLANCPTGAATAPTLLQVAPGLSSGNTVREEISGATSVTYLASGQTSNGLVGTSYQFVFCDARGVVSGQDIEINLIGRVESAGTPGQSVSGGALAAC